MSASRLAPVPALMNSPQPLEPVPDWEPHERPMFPGSPSTPAHPTARRVAYLLVGLLVGITGALGTALVSVNLPVIQGQLGLTPAEAAWLPAAYVLVNVSSNLVLYKVRQQYGVRLFVEVGIVAYVAVMGLHLVANDYGTALFARAVSGFAAAPMNVLGFFYMLQAFPTARRGQGLCIALGVSQLAMPIAWLVSPALLDLGDWRTLYRFETGLALASLAAVIVLKLPPGIRVRVIERLDFLTFALVAPALALIGAVLTQGRIQWWTEQPWMAWALIVAILLLSAAWLVEHHRRNPLIQTRWLGTMDAVRFAVGAIGMRFLLAEQTYAVPGLLRTLGMGAEQLQPLYAVVLAGIVVGVAASALTFGPRAMIPQILSSVVLIAVGSFMDWGATSLTRPHDLFASQFLVACASGLFMGPLLLMGVMRALRRGADHIVSFTVLFALTQSVGGLAGVAFFGTYQQHREHEHSAAIAAAVDPTDPVVAQRLQLQAQVYGRVDTDPVRRPAQGVGQLAQLATREAHVRAYNDVFLLNGFLAIGFLCWELSQAVLMVRAARAGGAGTGGRVPGGGPSLPAPGGPPAPARAA